MTTRIQFPGGLRIVDERLEINVAGFTWDVSACPNIQAGDYVIVPAQSIVDPLDVSAATSAYKTHHFPFKAWRVVAATESNAKANPYPIAEVPADRFPPFGRDPLLRKVDSEFRIMVCGHSYSVRHLPVAVGSLVQVVPVLPLPEQTTATAESRDAAPQSTSALPRRLRNQGRTGPKPSRPVHSGSVIPRGLKGLSLRISVSF